MRVKNARYSGLAAQLLRGHPPMVASTQNRTAYIHPKSQTSHIRRSPSRLATASILTTGSNPLNLTADKPSTDAPKDAPGKKDSL